MAPASATAAPAMIVVCKGLRMLLPPIVLARHAPPERCTDDSRCFANAACSRSRSNGDGSLGSPACAIASPASAKNASMPAGALAIR